MTQWSVMVGNPASFSEIRAWVLAFSENASCGLHGSRVYVAPAMALVVDADALNNEGEKLPKLFRRVSRRQGRINRTIVSAAKTLFEEVGVVDVIKDAGALAEIAENLDRAFALNSMARGNEYARRIHRPQAEINIALNTALARLSNYVTGNGRAMYARTDKTPQLEESLIWHVREAAYRNSLFEDMPRWIRRWRTDQFIINRCHIISIRLICELLSQ